VSQLHRCTALAVITFRGGWFLWAGGAQQRGVAGRAFLGSGRPPWVFGLALGSPGWIAPPHVLRGRPPLLLHHLARTARISGSNQVVDSLSTDVFAPGMGTGRVHSTCETRVLPQALIDGFGLVRQLSSWADTATAHRHIVSKCLPWLASRPSTTLLSSLNGPSCLPVRGFLDSCPVLGCS
jgi:hypothetical protein